MSDNNLVILGEYGPAQPLAEAPAPAPAGAFNCTDPGNPILNCSFETGDFTNWVAQDLTTPFFPLQVAGPTNIGYGFFTSAPTEGTVSALTGFDGDGPGTIELGQDVTLPSGGTVTLNFDYRAAWDLDTFSDGAQARTFEVHVEPSGGGAALQTDVILTALGDTINLDTGPQSGAVDLTSFAGQGVRVNFVWNVPENFTGPAFFELDNVQVAAAGQALPPPAAVPALDAPALGLLTAMLLVAAGLILYRRRSV